MKNFLHKIGYLSGMLLIFLMPLSGAVLVQAQNAGTAVAIGIRIVGAKSLNIRSAPSVGNNIIGHFNQGDRVNVREKNKTGKWCHVDYQNRNDAWVYCKGLMVPGTAKPKGTKKPFGQTYAPSPVPAPSPTNVATGQLPTLTSDVNSWQQANIDGLTFRYPPELSFVTGSTNKNGKHYYVMNVTPRHLYLKISVRPVSAYDSMVKKFNQGNMLVQSGTMNVGNVTAIQFVHANTVGKKNPRIILLAKNKANTYVIDNLGNDPTLFNKFLSTFNVQA